MAKVDPPSDYVFKILVVGDSGVGKTCLLQRFVDDLAKPSYIATIGSSPKGKTYLNSPIDHVGIDFKVKTIRIDGDIVKLEIWLVLLYVTFCTLTSSTTPPSS